MNYRTTSFLIVLLLLAGSAVAYFWLRETPSSRSPVVLDESVVAHQEADARARAAEVEAQRLAAELKATQDAAAREREAAAQRAAHEAASAQAQIARERAAHEAELARLATERAEATAAAVAARDAALAKLAAVEHAAKENAENAEETAARDAARQAALEAQEARDAALVTATAAARNLHLINRFIYSSNMPRRPHYNQYIFMENARIRAAEQAGADTPSK